MNADMLYGPGPSEADDATLFADDLTPAEVEYLGLEPDEYEDPDAGSWDETEERRYR